MLLILFVELRWLLCYVHIYFGVCVSIEEFKYIVHLYMQSCVPGIPELTHLLLRKMVMESFYSSNLIWMGSCLSWGGVVISSNAQVLHLALHSGVIPGGVQRTIQNAWDQPRSASCMASILPTILSLYFTLVFLNSTR